VHRSKRSNLRKRTFKLKIQLLVPTTNLEKQLVLVAKGILKLGDSQGKTLGRQIITYIGVRDISQWLAHEAKAGEIAFLGHELLILLWAGGVITGEVKVAQRSTRSGHDLLELLILLVPEAILLLIAALTARVILVGVVVLVGGVKLLPLGAVGDEVGGITAHDITPRWSPPLLAELVQGKKFSHQQGNLVVGDALILLIRSRSQRRQGKLQSR
jgi:hypothetical protein